MSADARLWLPLDALDCGRVRDAVGGAVATWSARWLAGAPAAAGEFEPCAGAAPRRPSGWRAHAAGIALSAGAPETIRLAGLALDAEPDQLVLSEVDQDIIGRLAATIAADLARAVAAAIGLECEDSAEPAPLDDPFHGGGGLLFSATDGWNRPLVAGAITRAALVPFLKAAIPPGRRAHAPLSRLSRAVAASEVRIEARLGNAVIALGEVAALSPGDVLILDRRVADGAELSLGRSARPFARGALTQNGDGVSLTLSSSQRES